MSLASRPKKAAASSQSYSGFTSSAMISTTTMRGMLAWPQPGSSTTPAMLCPLSADASASCSADHTVEPMGILAEKPGPTSVGMVLFGVCALLEEKAQPVLRIKEKRAIFEENTLLPLWGVWCSTAHRCGCFPQPVP